jgi:hypothetical protein
VFSSGISEVHVPTGVRIIRNTGIVNGYEEVGWAGTR